MVSRSLHSSFIVLIALAVATVGVATTTSTHAAGVSPQTGQVYVNAGEGFFVIQNSTFVGPGSQVMVPEGASAYIAFSASCTTTIVGPRTVEIPAQLPCPAGQATPSPGWDQAAAPAAPGIGTEAVVIGGVVVAAGVGAAVALSNKSASP